MLLETPYKRGFRDCRCYRKHQLRMRRPSRKGRRTSRMVSHPGGRRRTPAQLDRANEVE
jgi:hypothetical protein